MKRRHTRAGWIDVREDLPEFGKRVLVAVRVKCNNPRGYYLRREIASYLYQGQFNEGIWGTYDKLYGHAEVAYWRVMAGVPKED